MADIDALLAKYAPPPVAAGGADPVAAQATGGSDIDSLLAKYSAPSGGLGLGDAEMAGSGPTTEGPGLAESVVRGGVQGLTFGFADEISGALESLTSKKTYKQARDESRAAFKAADEAHPIGSGLGNVIGSVLSGVATGGLIGATGRLAGGALGSAAVGAVEGAAAGLGSSEKEGIGAFKDAGTQGLIGAGLGGVIGKAFNSYALSSVGRAEKAVLSDLVDRSTPTTRAKLADLNRSVDVAKVAEIHGLSDLANPAARAKAASAAKNSIGKQIGETFDQIDGPAMASRTEAGTLAGSAPLPAARAPSGVAPKRVFDSLEELRKGLDGPSAAPMRDRLARYIEQVRSEWGDLKAIPLKKLNKEISALEAQGFASTDLAPKAAAQLQRKAAAAMEGHLQDGLKAAGDVASGLPELNRQYRALLLLEKAAKEQARKAPFSPTGLRDIAREQGGRALPLAAAALGMGGDLLSGGLYYGGFKALQAVGGKANRSATLSLAKLVRDAKAGVPGKRAAMAAIMDGVPAATVRGVLSLGGHSPPWLDELPQE